MRKLSFIFILFFLSIQIHGQDVVQGDKDALIALYNSTNGGSWTDNTNWGTNEPVSTWYGVIVDGDRVSGLMLSINNLQGTIATEIGNMSALKYLSMSGNQLSGSIPAEIGSLVSLEDLTLSLNQLEGAIPPEIGNLVLLKTLILSENLLEGAIPPEIGNLSELNSLWLSSNNLTGSIPPEIGNLLALNNLWLDNNNFTGSIPVEIQNINGLSQLVVNNNQLSGNLPDLSGLVSPSSLWIMYNNYSFDAIETGLTFGLDQFVYTPQNEFKLSNNQFISVIGSDLDIDISDLSQNNLGSNLQYEWYKDGFSLGAASTSPILSLSNNQVSDYGLYVCHVTNSNTPGFELISEPISVTGGNTSPIVANPIIDLSLSNGFGSVIIDLLNVFYDADGDVLSFSSNLDNIDCVSVSITNGLLNITEIGEGSVTITITADDGNGATISESFLVSIGQQSGLEQDKQALMALYNATDGPNWTINTNWGTSEPLETWHGVSVANNRVVGLTLFSNNLVGNLPEEIGVLTNLTSLILPSNKLVGTIPSTIGELTNLTSLVLGMNELSGSIPSEISNLTNLQSLGVQNNKFNGPLPDFSSLTKLVDVDISNNLFTFVAAQAGLNYGLTSFVYFPQLEFPLSINQHSVSLGTNLNINITDVSISNLGENLQFQWYKDGNLISSNSGELNLTNINESDFGIYTCQVGSTGVPNLVLISEEIIIMGQDVIDADREALMALYNATDGPNWKINTNWGTTEPVDTWYGITVANNRVVEINLHNNNLTGAIPAEIRDLTKLTNLDLSTNNLNGSIPSGIGTLESLKGLSLHSNQLNGTIPIEIFNLINLTYLYLHNNELNGQVPSEIGNLLNLRNLFLSGNQLSSSIPSEIGTLVNLTILDLNNNQLSGSIPSEIGSLTELMYMSLCDNLFAGSIPTEIGNLTKLTVLDLTNAGLSGTIPAEIGNLTNLMFLFLQQNELNGAIPPELGNLGNLVGLNLSNNQLSGTIPLEISSLISLKSIYLQKNLLSGGLPDLSILSSLDYLNLSNNQFTFEAAEAGLGYGLSQFYYNPQHEFPLTTNEFSISFGSNLITNITDLATSHLGENLQFQWYKDDSPMDIFTAELNIANFKITDAGTYTCHVSSTVVPDLILISEGIEVSGQGVILADREALMALYNATGGENWTNNNNWGTEELVENWLGVKVLNNRVVEINLPSNNLTGIIPEEIGNLTNLEWLNLSDNNLSGKIPAGIGNLNSIKTLALQSNQLTGSIPTELWDLSSLEILWLASNQLSGTLTTDISKLNSLKDLSLSSNEFSGSIPGEISNLSVLTNLTLDNNGFSGEIPETIGGLTQLKLLNLAYNQLSGNIPVEIANLTDLESFYLSNNDISGSIPSEIGELTNLTWLSLSSNKLNGLIPVEIENLTLLSGLDLDENQLNGSLPDLSGLTNLEYLSLRHNNFTFLAVEAGVLYGITEFYYEDQSDFKLNETEKIVALGANVELNILNLAIDDLGGAKNEYYWYKDGVLVPDQVSSTTLQLSSIEMSDFGNYTCVVTNTNVPNLSITSEVLTISQSNTTSVNEMGKDFVKIYPNPATGVIHLECNDLKSKKSIVIYNNSGKKVLSKQLANNKESVDLSEFSKGLYFVEYVNGNYKSVERIIIE